MVKFLFTVFVVIFFGSMTTMADAALTASLSRSQIGIHESVSLDLTLEGDGEDGDPELQALDSDFEVVASRQSSQINIINGTLQRTRQWSLTLLPRRVGTLTIPALCSGQHCSQPLTLVVNDQAPSDPATANVLLEAEISAPQVVAQAQLVFTVRLLMHQPLADARLSELSPQGVETRVIKLGEDVHYESERANRRYQVIERRYALFPEHAGQLTLPPLRLDGRVQTRQRARLDPRFDLFGDRFGDGGQPIRLHTETLQVTVTAPPDDRGQQPWLPAQALKLEDNWQSQPEITLTVGEPATRTVTVRAAGLTAAQLPELRLTAPESFKSYPDQPSRNDLATPGGLSAVMEQKVALLPTRAGIFTLPPLNVRWWDITENRWRTESLPARSVTVLPGERDSATSAAPSAAPPAAAATAPDAPPSPRLAPLSPPPAAASGDDGLRWLLVSVGCAAGWLLTVLGWLWTIRRRKKRNTAATTAATPPMPGVVSRRQVIQLARLNQPHATRQALLAWLKTLHPHQPDYGLEQFTQQADATLRTALLALDRHLYAAQEQPWQGDALAQALHDWSAAPPPAAADTLPSFYPGAEK